MNTHPVCFNCRITHVKMRMYCDECEQEIEDLRKLHEAEILVNKSITYNQNLLKQVAIKFIGIESYE